MNIFILCLQEAMVWGAIFAGGALASFVCGVTATLWLQVDLITPLAAGYRYLAEQLVRWRLLDAKNVGGALLLGHVVPWATAGLLFGIARRLRNKKRAAHHRATVLGCTVLVLGLFVAGALILCW